MSLIAQWESIKSKIEKALEEATWEKQKSMTPDDFEGYTGRADGHWIFTVAAFKQNGEWRYDGAGGQGGMIVHLPPDLAQKAVETARLRIMEKAAADWEP